MKWVVVSTLTVFLGIAVFLGSILAQTAESETENGVTESKPSDDIGATAREAASTARSSSRRSNSELSTKDAWTIGLGILGFVGVIAGIAIGAENVAFQIRAGRWASEIERIEQQLDEFYGPLQRLLETNYLLHKILKSAQPNEKEFRTLDELMGGYSFSANDKALIAELIEIDRQLLELIDSKGGFVEGTITISAGTDKTLEQLGVEVDDIISDPKTEPEILKRKGPIKVQVHMSKILAKACRHFRIIRLAHEGKLTKEVERFKDFVYPRGLNRALDAEIDRLKERQRDLQRQIDSGPRGQAG